MANIYDDGMSAEELAIALGFAEEIAEEERNRFQSGEDELLVPDEDAPEWYEEE
jgi:hypothetical protein